MSIEYNQRLIKERIDRTLSIQQLMDGITSLEEKMKFLIDKVSNIKDREVVVQSQNIYNNGVSEEKKHEKSVPTFVPSVDTTDLKIQTAEPIRKKKSGMNVGDSLDKLSEV